MRPTQTPIMPPVLQPSPRARVNTRLCAIERSSITARFQIFTVMIVKATVFMGVKVYSFAHSFVTRNVLHPSSGETQILTLFGRLQASAAVLMGSEFLWVVTQHILGIFDFMFQLNAPFVYYIHRISVHVSSNIVLIIRRIHCINTASGSLYVTLLRWPLSAHEVSPLTACALSGHLRRVTYKEPDAVCMQWILLMMSTMLLETCRGMRWI